MTRSKPIAFLLASLALAPALAAGRPACCLKTGAATTPSHGCCAATTPARTSGPKGCCKSPVAPMPEAKARTSVPAAIVTQPLDLGSPAWAPLTLPEAVSVRLARCAHRAETPDESPPDVLSRIHVLLI